MQAGTAPCKHARLRMQPRFGRSPTKAPLTPPTLRLPRSECRQCAAGYPSTTQLAALNSLLALLALKLYEQRRRSHVYDIVHDRALGLFCGLNVLPKRTHLTSYSYRAPHVNTTSRCWKRSSPASVRSG